MKRVKVAPRDNADEKARRSGVFAVEKTLNNGLVHRSWDENSAYVINKEEVATIVDTVAKVTSMSKEAVDFLLDGEWGTLGMTQPVFDLVRNSFDSAEKELFTRYDFAYTADSELKLVGIEADSPQFLIETAHTQRTWLYDIFGSKIKNNKVTQLNSIPEMTTEAFRNIQKVDKNVHIFTGADDRGEDWITSAYVKGLVQQAGCTPHAARVKGLQWNEQDRQWKDERGGNVTSFYKQYPWELLMLSSVSKPMVENSSNFKNMLEPTWKMALANRAMLPALHYLFPESNIISPAKIDDRFGLGPDYVTAPVLQAVSRNEMAHLKGRTFTSWGENMKDFSGQQSLSYRKLEIPKRYRDISGGYRFTFLSVFTVGGHIAGVGIRESRLPLLGAHTTFKPHVVML